MPRWRPAAHGTSTKGQRLSSQTRANRDQRIHGPGTSPTTEHIARITVDDDSCYVEVLSESTQRLLNRLVHRNSLEEVGDLLYRRRVTPATVQQSIDHAQTVLGDEDRQPFASRHREWSVHHEADSSLVYPET